MVGALSLLRQACAGPAPPSSARSTHACHSRRRKLRAVLHALRRNRCKKEAAGANDGVDLNGEVADVEDSHAGGRDIRARRDEPGLAKSLDPAHHESNQA